MTYVSSLAFPGIGFSNIDNLSLADDAKPTVGYPYGHHSPDLPVGATESQKCTEMLDHGR
jgi:hypothetical protein